MKTLKTKLFISISLVATVIVACFAAAYTIHIGNRETYGTLNLGKLLLWRTSDGAGTGIEIDGQNYVIKIGEYAGSDEYSKIHVSNICSRTGGNCKTLTELAQDNDSSNYLDIQGNGTSAVKFDQHNNKTLNIVGGGDTTVAAEDNKITISFTDNDTRRQNTKSTGGHVTAPNGNTGKVRKVNENGEPSWQNDDTGSISVTAYTPTLRRGEANDIIVVNGSTAKVTMPTNPHYTGSIVAASTSNGNDNTSTTNTGTYLNYVENSSVKSYLQLKGSGTTTVSANGGIITIYSSGSDGGGDSLWTGTSTLISPKQDQSVKIKNGISFEMSSYNKHLAGLSVGGPISVGDAGTDNYIYMFAVGTGGNNSRHYEIMGSKELAIGTVGRGFIYFNNKGTTNYEKYSIGVNTITPKATLDVNGTIRVGAECVECSDNTLGTIVFSDNDFWGCKMDGENPKWFSLTTGGKTGYVSTDCGVPNFLHEATQLVPNGSATL